MFYEEDILDPTYRKKVIQEITSPENVNRKNEYLKRYEVYKDMTKKWVQQALINEGLKPATVAQMMNRGSNISICKKIVNKKARVYQIPAERQVLDNEQETAQIEQIVDLLNFDEKMKKADRYRELHRNSMLLYVPKLDQLSQDDSEKFKIIMRVLAPWQYDVIEDSGDREKMRCLILSDFVERGREHLQPESEYSAGVHGEKIYKQTTNNEDDKIADDPEDAGMNGKREFVWWSSKYHFTTDSNGAILTDKSPEDLSNPIECIPGVNNAQDQDGQFWAQGGDDLVDGSVLINKLLTDMFFVQYLQGYGQPVITGKNVKNERFHFGPNNAIIIDYDPSAEEPEPKIDFISASPDIPGWLAGIEAYLAMLLTTNNLSPANVSSKLDAQNFASGIAMLIEQSEVTEDITDKQGHYLDVEMQSWDIIGRWSRIYDVTGEFNDDWYDIGLPEDTMVNVKYHDPKPKVTEGEKLENLKKRYELGINEKVDLIMIDNPDMTRDEAEQKLLKIMAERVQNFTSAVQGAISDNQNDDVAGGDKLDDISEDDKKSIVAEASGGKKHSEIAKQFNIKTQKVTGIVREVQNDGDV
jgi:hypothetical protein